MRWLFHIRRVGDQGAPESLVTAGFVHASFLADVAGSARLYFPAGAERSVPLSRGSLGSIWGLLTLERT